MQTMLEDASALALFVLSNGSGATTDFALRVEALKRIASLMKLDTSRLIFMQDNKPFELMKRIPSCTFFVGEDQEKFANAIAKRYAHVQIRLIARDNQSSTNLRLLYTFENFDLIAHLCQSDEQLIAMTLDLLHRDSIAQYELG